jgi:hypothetical protein
MLKNAQHRQQYSNLEVDAKENVFQNAGDNQQNVEHGHEAVIVLTRLLIKYPKNSVTLNTNLAKRRLLLRWCQNILAIACETGLGFVCSQTVRSSGILGVDIRPERRAELRKRQLVFGDIDLFEILVLAALGLGFGFVEVLVAGGSELLVLLSHLPLHFDACATGLHPDAMGVFDGELSLHVDTAGAGGVALNFGSVSVRYPASVELLDRGVVLLINFGHGGKRGESVDEGVARPCDRAVRLFIRLKLVLGQRM